MGYNIRVNKLLKGLNVSLEDFRFYMSNDEINPTSKINVITNGDIVYNPKLMTTQELVELRESLLKDIETKEICRLYKALDEAKGEVLKIEEAIKSIEERYLDDVPGPWSPDWLEEKIDEVDIDELVKEQREKTAEAALEDLKRRMEKENENKIWSPDWLKEDEKPIN